MLYMHKESVHIELLISKMSKMRKKSHGTVNNYEGKGKIRRRRRKRKKASI